MGGESTGVRGFCDSRKNKPLGHPEAYAWLVIARSTAAAAKLPAYTQWPSVNQALDFCIAISTFRRLISLQFKFFSPAFLDISSAELRQSRECMIGARYPMVKIARSPAGRRNLGDLHWWNHDRTDITIWFLVSPASMN